MALPTPQEDRLKRLLAAKDEQIKTARDTWDETLTQVRRSHHEITQGVPNLIKGLDSETGASVRRAFTEMGSALDVRRQELKDARDALDAVLVDLSISKFLYTFAGPPPTKAKVDPLPADADTDAQVKHDADKQTAQTNYENDVADRERYCKWIADGLEQTFGDSADVLRNVHGEPTRHPADDSERPPRVPPLAIPTGGGNVGNPGTNPGFVTCPVPEQPMPEIEYPICDKGPELPPELPDNGGTDTVTEFTPVNHTPQNPTVITTTGTAPGIGTIGMAGAGALTGGALIRAALRSIGVTPAGSTPTTRQVGLGRPGANGRAAGVGSPVRAGGAAGAGAAGRGGRGAGGGRAGVAGAGTRGAAAGGARGAAGGRGGAGAGAGARGRGKGKKGTAANPDIFEAEHDWYENEGQPGILD